MKISSVQSWSTNSTNVAQDKKMSHSSLSLKKDLTADTFSNQGTGKVSFKGVEGGMWGFAAGALLGTAAVILTGGAAAPVVAAAYLGGGAAGAALGSGLEDS